MNFGDIVALAKAGYKPSDIKELMTLKAPEEKAPETPDKEEDHTPEAEAETKVTDTEPKKPEDEIDYKALYEAEKAKVEKFQKENISATKARQEDPLEGFDYLVKLMETER